MLNRYFNFFVSVVFALNLTTVSAFAGPDVRGMNPLEDKTGFLNLTDANTKIKVSVAKVSTNAGLRWRYEIVEIQPPNRVVEVLAELDENQKAQAENVLKSKLDYRTEAQKKFHKRATVIGSVVSTTVLTIFVCAVLFNPPAYPATIGELIFYGTAGVAGGAVAGSSLNSQFENDTNRDNFYRNMMIASIDGKDILIRGDIREYIKALKLVFAGKDPCSWDSYVCRS